MAIISLLGFLAVTSVAVITPSLYTCIYTRPPPNARGTALVSLQPPQQHESPFKAAKDLALHIALTVGDVVKPTLQSGRDLFSSASSSLTAINMKGPLDLISKAIQGDSGLFLSLFWGATVVCAAIILISTASFFEHKTSTIEAHTAPTITTTMEPPPDEDPTSPQLTTTHPRRELLSQLDEVAQGEQQATKEGSSGALTPTTAPPLKESSFSAVPTPIQSAEGNLLRLQQNPTFDEQDPTTSSPSALFGKRSSLKRPSTHTPSAKVPSHKTTPIKGTPNGGGGSTFSSTFGWGSSLKSPLYAPRQPQRLVPVAPAAAVMAVSPTTATAQAVFGETEVPSSAVPSAVPASRESLVWKIEDLEEELKATRALVAALKGQLVREEIDFP